MLDHSYPNPFNDKIQITLSLLSFSNFELSIVDLKGAKVKTLQKGKKSKGMYQFAWDGRGEKRKSCCFRNIFCFVSDRIQYRISKNNFIKIRYLF